MPEEFIPSETPNVVIEDPRVRKVANIVLGAALIIVPTLGILDASSAELDFAAWLVPTTAVTMYLAGIFNVAVTRPNIPSSRGD